MKRVYELLISLSIVLCMCFANGSGAAVAEAAEADGSQNGGYGSFVSGDQVIKDMIEENGMYSHPRIIMTEDKFAKLRSHIGDDSVTGILLEKLRSEADSKLGSAVLPYEITDGIRLLETSKRIQRRVAALALAYNVFGDEKYAQRAYKELANAAKFKDWNPYHFLDTAEMTTAFAIGYDWLYNWMTADQRAVLRNAMIEKGLKQVLQDYEDKPADRSRTYRWYQDFPGDNWKLVCTGSMNMAALAIGDEKDARDVAAKVLNYGYKEAYSFVRRAYSDKDGTYTEGLGYWDYATYYLGLNSSSLISATGTDYGLADFEGLRKSVDFVRYMSSNTPKSFSFGDDRESRDTGWAVFLWLGEYFDSYDIASVRLKKIAKDEFNYLDVLWIDEEGLSRSANEIPTDWGAVGSSNASFRDTWDNSGLVAALHTGLNNYKYHGHYDLGSFYVEANGARFFTDLGNENYELKDRLYSYRIRAEGHNTLVINPSKELDQSEGAECLITSFSGGNEAFAVTDLTDAYKASGAKSVVRGLKMIKDKECVIVQDEISLNTAGEIYWFAHTAGQISVASDGRSAIVTVGSDRLWVGLLSEGGKFSVMSAKLLSTSRQVSGQTSNSGYRKLAIHLTNTKDTTISVVCIPLKSGESKPSWLPTLKSISQWTAAPTVTASAAKASVTAGETFKITAEANGSGTLKYQWQSRKDSSSAWTNSAQSGAKTSTLSAATTVGLHGWQFRCVVTDGSGRKAYSKAVTVTVVPKITTEPVNKTVNVGDTLKYTIAASGKTRLSYQWQSRKNSSSAWANSAQSGAKTTTLSVKTTAGLQGWQFRCVVTDGNGQKSYSKTMTVSLATPTITKQPTATSVKVGTKATFSVAATGKATLRYQWQSRKNSSAEWTNSGLSGAKTANLTVAATAGLNGWQFRCVVTDGNGMKTYSSVVTLTVK
ncbi:MAG: heparinase II/III family protein [Lachnospiraceae bacterium]|nr:heparinase II/III family protein [Lachnospiraceae bacterium]